MRMGLLLLASLATLAATPPAQALERVIDISNDRWVEVTGEGSVSAAPDFARVTLGVTSTGKTAGDALAANAKAANTLAALIREQGIGGADIQTSNVSITPMYAQSSSSQASPPTISGYSVSNDVAVMVRDISRLGGLIDKATAAGANSIYGVSFGHNDASALLDKARPMAVADARRKAELYASAGGARLGRLMVLTEEANRQPAVAFARAYVSGAPAPTPIAAGEDRLTVTVTARFELTQ
jgi:uncharacterized protein